MGICGWELHKDLEQSPVLWLGMQWQVMELHEVIRILENAGEVGLSVTMHHVDGATVKQSKACCFVLESPKGKSLQKKVGAHKQQVLAISVSHSSK